ncbi:Uncharacterized protein Rs2_19499 [Raphanus sativus]|nr:Uncharacterized protein Rs2_19499 [Raphanus sativus]
MARSDVWEPPRRSGLVVGRGETSTSEEKSRGADIVAREAKTLRNHLGMEPKPELQIRIRSPAELKPFTNGYHNREDVGLGGRIDRGRRRKLKTMKLDLFSLIRSVKNLKSISEESSSGEE